MTIEPNSTLTSLIATVGEGSAAMRLATERVEEARSQGVSPSRADMAVMEGWLRDATRIAAISCDQPHVLSKELGARLDAVTARLRAHLKP